MPGIYSRDTFLGKEAEVRVASKRMLDAGDIQVLREMFGEQGARFDRKIDRVREELLAAMEKGFSAMRDEILDVIEDNIQPQFNTLNARVTRLERKLA